MEIRDGGGKASEDEKELEEAHKYYARTLRTWLIFYGIGGPVLLLSNKELAIRFEHSPDAWRIVYAFLIGLGLQLLVVLAFKTALWYLTYGERYAEFRTSRRYKFSLWLTDAYWLELLLDIISCLVFGWASIEVARILLAP
jgi:hypothetical protein